jgi:anti-sigma factor RsiW
VTPEDHAAHDPELIAQSLDRDAPPETRAAVDRLVATCAACAALRNDLLAIAAATTSLPTPARPRDFTITPDVASAVRQATTDRGRDTARGEPILAGARLTGEMTDTRVTHARHDRLLIANLLDRTPDPAERARGERQLADCADCARLHADLLALSEATKALPVPSRSRDFTLSPADAERLRVRGWRRLIALIGSGRDTFTRPLAIGLTTLGLAGLLVGTVPGFLFVGGATSALQTAEDASRNAAGGAGTGAGAPEAVTLGSAAPSAAAASGPALAATAPTEAPPAGAFPAPTGADASAEPDRLFEGGESSPLAGEPADRGALDEYTKSLVGDSAGPPSAFVIAAGVLLLVGLGLFGLRWTARRLGDG